MRTFVVAVQRGHDGGDAPRWAILETRHSSGRPEDVAQELGLLCDLHPGSSWGEITGLLEPDRTTVADARFKRYGEGDPVLRAAVDADVRGLRLQRIPASVPSFLAWRALHPEAGFSGWVVRDERGRFFAYPPCAPPHGVVGEVTWVATLDAAASCLALVAESRLEVARG